MQLEDYITKREQRGDIFIFKDTSGKERPCLIACEFDGYCKPMLVFDITSNEAHVDHDTFIPIILRGTISLVNTNVLYPIKNTELFDKRDRFVGHCSSKLLDMCMNSFKNRIESVEEEKLDEIKEYRNLILNSDYKIYRKNSDRDIEEFNEDTAPIDEKILGDDTCSYIESLNSIERRLMIFLYDTNRFELINNIFNIKGINLTNVITEINRNQKLYLYSDGKYNKLSSIPEKDLEIIKDLYSKNIIPHNSKLADILHMSKTTAYRSFH